MPSPRYTERQSTYPVFYAVFILVAAIVGGLGVYGAFTGTYDVSAVGLLGVGIICFIFLSFLHMRLEVYDDRVVIRYGVFKKTVVSNHIAAVSVQPYDFWKYGGWGIRWSWSDHSTAWVTRSGPGIWLELMEGKKVFISARRPEEALRHIEESRGYHGA